MIKNVRFVTGFVSGYLVLYCLLLGIGGIWRAIAVGMFFCSPVVVAWMAFIIVRYGTHRGRELGDGEEFGYDDRETGKLGVW